MKHRIIHIDNYPKYTSPRRDKKRQGFVSFFVVGSYAIILPMNLRTESIVFSVMHESYGCVIYRKGRI